MDSMSLKFGLALIFSKYLFDFFVLATGAKLLKCTPLLKHLVWAELIQVPLTVWAVPAGYFKLYKWK
jgi:hypothetical protein